jgi:TonB family protein
MIKLKGNLTGILGTLIIHLIAAIIFLSMQLRSMDKEISTQYEVELSAVPEPVAPIEKTEAVPVTSVEKVLKDDEEMLNIARNLANKPAEKIDASDYIDKVKEELIQSGKLGTDNFIDEQKNGDRSEGTESIGVKTETPSEKTVTKPGSAQEMAANFQGATRIYYELVGRNHLYLPIPIYKCQGSGKVVLSIEVDRNGTVQRAQILERSSTATDPCLIETAINTAMISRFNPDSNSPKVQIGTLTYQFVAQ